MEKNLPLVKVGMPAEDILMPVLRSVLYSGFIAEGEYVYRFENEFARIFNLPIALAVSSGSAALHIALLIAGVSKNSEVITTSMTAEPTNTVILQSGATPVFADIDPTTGNLDPSAVERQITERTRAIVVVHYAGFPAPLKKLREIADKNGLVLIEDCAHALGARYEGDGIGTIGDFGIFSLQAIKHMTTIDGGILTMREQNKVKIARQMRWFGLEKGVARLESDIKVLGFKYNMSNVTAAIGLVQLEGIQERIEKHINNGRYFDSELAKIPGLEVTHFESVAHPSFWLYTILSNENEDVERRLGEIGVSASKLHRPNHLHSIFNCRDQYLPGLTNYYQRLTHIPCGWWVSDEQRAKIVSTLAKG